MEPDAVHDDAEPKHATLATLDRRVLIGTLGVFLLGFASAWIGARGFLPGAQLFPDVIAGIGVVLTVGALIRVALGREPSSSPGRLPEGEAESRVTYVKAIRLVLGISGYFLAIYLIGFMPATGVFVVVFARVHSQTYVYAMAAATAALAAVCGLSLALNLFLPVGVLVEAIMGG